VEIFVDTGQGALLVYEGAVAAVLDAEGLYELATDNHPFINTLLRLRTGFASEHKLQIYFYRRADNVNQPWGTPTPLKYLDPVYQLPVQLGAYSNFSCRLADARRFFTQVVGLGDSYAVQQAKTLLQSLLGQVLATELAAAGRSYQQFDVAADTQAAAGLSYAKRENLKALREAARNAGGLAGAGGQLGAGAELNRLLARPAPR
jgi:membrane protease subunit (stomatin/prohibitin family)